MGDFERGVTAVLIFWGVLVLLGYSGTCSGAATSAKCESHG